MIVTIVIAFPSETVEGYRYINNMQNKPNTNRAHTLTHPGPITVSALTLKSCSKAPNINWKSLKSTYASNKNLDLLKKNLSYTHNL